MDYSRIVDSLTDGYNGLIMGREKPCQGAGELLMGREKPSQGAAGELGADKPCQGAGELIMGREKPCQGAGELASVITSSVSAGLLLLTDDDDHVQEERDSSVFCQSKENDDNMVELACVSLTLVEKISSKLMTSPQTHYLWEVWRELFQRHDIMSKLVQCFHTEDRMLSHLAAKSASTSVICQLHYFDAVHPVWQQKCVEAFQSPCPCAELDACIWSLTNVLKTLLKASEERKTEKLLVALDPALSALFSKLLPEDEEGERSAAHRGGTVCIFLDLLEVLTASRSIRGTGNPLPCQRLVHSRTAALLRLVDSPGDYFVKKRALLLLKRVVLQRAGDDMMALGALSSSSTGVKGQQLCQDMTSLAEGVLRAVDGGWLRRLPVTEASSSFGGSRRRSSGGGAIGSSRCRSPGGGATAAQERDYVMLRAVSLILVKSLELAMHSHAGPGADHRAMEVTAGYQQEVTAGYRQEVTAGYQQEVTAGYQQALLAFLREHHVPLTEPGHPPGSWGHPCSWLTQVFGEQDDDLMEAAKSLLLMSSSSRSPGACDAASASSHQGEPLCASGSNPHCHFLLLLLGVSFDHSILLDFLISTETCFLEYCVRYLKHLAADREGFLQACQRAEETFVDPGGRVEHCSSAASALSREGATWPPASSGAAGPSVASTGAREEVRLVDYGSSEESNTESDMEVEEASQQEDAIGTSGDAMEEVVRGGSLEDGWSLNRATSGRTAAIVVLDSSSHTHVQTEHRSSGGDDSAARAVQTTMTATTGSVFGQKKGRTGEETARRSRQTLPVLSRALLCLSELGRLVARLHAKNLFPYNPTSLLRLLTRAVETLKTPRHC